MDKREIKFIEDQNSDTGLALTPVFTRDNVLIRQRIVTTTAIPTDQLGRELETALYEFRELITPILEKGRHINELQGKVAIARNKLANDTTNLMQRIWDMVPLSNGNTNLSIEVHGGKLLLMDGGVEFCRFEPDLKEEAWELEKLQGKLESDEREITNQAIRIAWINDELKSMERMLLVNLKHIETLTMRHLPELNRECQLGEIVFLERGDSFQLARRVVSYVTRDPTPGELDFLRSLVENDPELTAHVTNKVRALLGLPPKSPNAAE